MVTHNDIGWGRYKNYEGPFYRGKHAFKLPETPTEDDRVMAVVTATEGGCYDAWNGYDVCGWTSGLIQWCEGQGQFSVSDMLGVVGDNAPWALKPMIDLGLANGVEFTKNSRGKWRFFFMDQRGEVDSFAEQKSLFYVSGDGTVGTWSDNTKLYGKKWAAAISSVWEHPLTQELQRRFTAERLTRFMLPYAKGVFASVPPFPHAMALRAAYISFAANNPTWANSSLQRAISATAASQWTPDWCIAILKELTFGPKVAIYPHRYDAIRPVLERLYNVNLPDFSADLVKWASSTGMRAVSTKELQAALIKLGYDLGPAGADGIYGKKTKAAVLALEELSPIVPVDARDGMVDVFTWPALQDALEAKGLAKL